VHWPGEVLRDLAVTIADGGDALAHLAALRDQGALFGQVASDPTAWRTVQRVDDGHLDRLRQTRARARERVWAAGGGPRLFRGRQLILDFDATITVAHSEKQNATPTWKRTFGMHPLLCYLDRAEISGGEALAGLLRPGNAGSSTAADHIQVLEMALAALPGTVRPGNGKDIRLLARSDSAGASRAFAAALRDHGIEYSLGFPVDERVQAAVLALDERVWLPAVQADGSDRDGAWVTEITGMVDLSNWPTGSRLIVRKEHPHPGAQLSFTDLDGCRVTAFLTDTTGWHLPDLELRHRQHAVVEDRIRCGKDTGLNNFPLHAFTANTCWLELALAASDLITWSQTLCFTGELARTEPATFRYRILHVAARLSHTARQWRLRIDQDWP
ncbi:MAG: IS1380 family transposase, partial [Pseudonocardiaceae bacterium]